MASMTVDHYGHQTKGGSSFVELPVNDSSVSNLGNKNVNLWGI